MSTDKYRVEVADFDYWQRQIECLWHCPVKTDARGYVIAVAEGRYLDAYRIAREPNPFASICGRVCGAPCEMGCRRGSVDEPITIRALKRYATEKCGVEAVDPGATIAFSTARRDPNNPKRGTKVAVIGGGVGGFTAAHDLALLGYAVTVFESESIAGGMLVTGVPPYRLSRELVQLEIDAILSLGVELRLNTMVGKDITIPELRESGFEAILLATGLQDSRKIDLEGSNLNGVVWGMEFLREVNLARPVEIGERIVVVGGGSVAYDVARSALRVGSAEAKDFYQAADAARMALRAGAREIHLVCLESREEMPADEFEIEEGAEEGIHLHASRGPLQILGENGSVTGFATRKVISVFDAEGRFNPTFEDEPGEIIETDTVIFAIGQTADFTFLKDAEDIPRSRRGLIEIDPATKTTTIPDVFACGDVADGAKLFIDAIASAQQAAKSIDEYLRGRKAEERMVSHFNLPSHHFMPRGYLQKTREDPSIRSASERVGSTELIEFNYPESVANRQGSRCLKCHINTIFHGDRCILCNGCVDVCPTYCLALVPLSEIDLEPHLLSLFEERYGVDLKALEAEGGARALDKLGSVMLKDETLCIRCGYCARRCPTDAVTMEHFSFYKEFAEG